MFIDEEQGGAGYTEAGFTKLFEDKDLNLRGLRRMKPPDLSFQQWITWISNTGRLSPKNEVLILYISTCVLLSMLNLYF